MTDRVRTTVDVYGTRTSRRVVWGTPVRVYRQLTVRGVVTGVELAGRWVRGRRYQAYHPVTGVQTIYAYQP